MAAARQKEMKDNMTVEATTTFAVLEPVSEVCKRVSLLDPFPCGIALKSGLRG